MSQFVRTYSTEQEGKILSCHVYFVPSEEDLSLPFHLTLSAIIDPDFSDSPDPAISLDAPSECPLDLRIQEMSHFLSVLKLMYYA